MQNLPANVTRNNDTNIISIAASSNKGMLIRFLNEQVEEGFYALVIDYLKDHNFDLSTMVVDDDVKEQCSKLYELGEFVDENIKGPGKYDIDEWIEPLFKFVYGDIDPMDTDAVVNTTGIYRYSIWLIYLFQQDLFGEAMQLVGDRVVPLLLNTCYNLAEADDRPSTYDKAIMGYMDLINVVLEMDTPSIIEKSDAYIGNLEVLFDYFVEDSHMGNDYKIQFSMGLFNTYIRRKDYEKAFEFYGLNAEYIPVDNMQVYDNFKELIRNCNSTQFTGVLSRNVISALSKQDLYNKRIDSLLVEVCAFIRKVDKYIEEAPEMKKNMQVLGTSSVDKSNMFEGLYEYNLVFSECGIKPLVRQNLSAHSWDEKYEILDLLYTTLNVIFDGYSVYEISNRIEHQYVELNWIGNYVNANPSLLKMYFSIKEKIKAFKVRKDSILEKTKSNYEIKKLLEDRQKQLVFMAAEDLVENGLKGRDKVVLNTTYEEEKGKKLFSDYYAKIYVPDLNEPDRVESTSKFGFGKNTAVHPDVNKMFENRQLAEMLSKSEWLWNQHIERGKGKQTNAESTYSVACLIVAVKVLLSRKDGNKGGTQISSNEKVIITKTGKVIKLTDGAGDSKAISKSAELTVIDCINNINRYLKEPREDNVKRVKGYIDEWVNLILNNKFDQNTMLSVSDADEIRTKSIQLIKRLNNDLRPL